VIEGLNRILEGTALPGRDTLGALIERMLGGSSRLRGRVIAEEAIRRECVRRLWVDVGDAQRVLVVKYLPLDGSLREQRVVERWLPEIGLARHGPPLLGTAGVLSGVGVWHVYADLGDRTLEGERVDPVALQAGMRVIARLHGGFVEHPLLGECRATGRDFGQGFFLSSVRDALRALDGLQPPRAPLPQEHRLTCARLRERLACLLEEAPQRMQALGELRGPETLLHGDLWPSNLLVDRSGEVRLIDWDRAGVGPATFDLSTLIMRLPVALRLEALTDYRDAGGAAGHGGPERDDLNFLFESAECARLASGVIWPALEFWRRGEAWALDRLAAIERWFAELEPALPPEPDRAVWLQ
jgi:hypothetical protein